MTIYSSTRCVCARVGLAALVISLAASCGSGSPSSSASSTDAAESLADACLALAQAECALRQSCSDQVYADGVNIIANYGNLATCRSRQQQACLNNANAPGSGTNLSQIKSCAQTYSQWQCNDYLDNNANPPVSCLPAGALSNGQGCTFNAQCQSGFCGGNKYANCGMCAAQPADGDSCATSACAPGQECLTGTSGAMVCRGRLPVGSTTCTSDAPCQAFYSCVGASASDATKVGVCTAINQALGSTCGGGTPNPACDAGQGLACAGPTGSKTCQEVAYVLAPGPCGALADGSSAACIAGDCFTATGPAASTATDASCVAKADDGAACDTQLGPLCQTPARCVAASGSTQGTCVFPDATLCNLGG